MLFSLNEITRITAGFLLNGNGLSRVERVSLDSRKTNKNDCFMAIIGPNHDGHDFIDQVYRRGARAVIVSRKRPAWPKGLGVILVEDTVKALGMLARAHRERFSIPVVALTGSTGKTTTKELVAAVLQSQFKILKNIGTENNHIGVPLTLLQLAPAHEIVILEFGTNRFGDIRWLTRVAKPDVAVLTNIGEAHLELLKTPKNVFREKLDLVKGLAAGGPVIYNQDNRFLRTIPLQVKDLKYIKYSLEQKADFQARQVKIIDNKALQFKAAGVKFCIQTPVFHNVYNSLAAIACGRLFNMSYRRISTALKNFCFTPGRQHIIQTGKIWLIDDTYNANPVSFRSALQTLSLFQTLGRRILVCADMLELGKSAVTLHRQCGRLAGRLNLDMILTYGELSKYIAQGAQSENRQVAARHFQHLEHLNDYLKFSCRAGDVVLIKGSRRMQMERTSRFLEKNFK